LNGLLSADILSRLIGVIDLLDGRAVHAIAGNRDDYRPLEWCGGKPLALNDFYRDLGTTGLYVADLNALTGSLIQSESISAICASATSDEVLLDVGWTGGEEQQSAAVVAQLAGNHPNTKWIAATESAESIDAVGKLAQLVSADRVLIGLDYRQEELIAGDGNEASWIARASELRCAGVVILDLATVGTSQGPSTGEICRRIKTQAPDLTIYSGGGVRTADDVQCLVDAGCDRVLVATALQRSVAK